MSGIRDVVGHCFKVWNFLFVLNLIPADGCHVASFLFWKINLCSTLWHRPAHSANIRSAFRHKSTYIENKWLPLTLRVNSGQMSSWSSQQLQFWALNPKFNTRFNTRKCPDNVKLHAKRWWLISTEHIF